MSATIEKVKKGFHLSAEVADALVTAHAKLRKKDRGATESEIAEAALRKHLRREIENAKRVPA